jgi:starch synthase
MPPVLSPLRVLFIAAECAPLAKVGGLGDMVGSLPKALRALGHDVRVALPHYATIDNARYPARSAAHFLVDSRGGPLWATAHEVDHDGVPVYLISGPPIPPRPHIYGGIGEDGPKFVFFALAALNLCATLDWRPDVVHAHDWHAGASIGYLGTAGRSHPFFGPIASLFTIHNLPYSGVGAGDAVWQYNLWPSPYLGLPEHLRWTPMALALTYADVFNAVSPGYAREILTPEYGYGYEALLAARGDRLTGVLNGIDYEVWAPARDARLPARFDARSLDARAENKRALQLESGLPARPDAPLFGMVSRLDAQKGVDLVAPAMREFLKEDAQFVLLGTGDPYLEGEMAALARDFPGKAAAHLRFDAVAATHIYGGADVFLMPSRYEPCGLGQMIALRYGALPLVRATGGLADTVVDVSEKGGTGFVFRQYTPYALYGALARAQAFYADRAAWQRAQRRGMKCDFSWTQSAREYERLYWQAIDYRGRWLGKHT